MSDPARLIMMVPNPESCRVLALSVREIRDISTRRENQGRTDHGISLRIGIPQPACRVARRPYRNRLDRITEHVRDSADQDADREYPGTRYAVHELAWLNTVCLRALSSASATLDTLSHPVMRGTCVIRMPTPTANRMCPWSAGFGLVPHSFARCHPRTPRFVLVRRHSSAGSAVPVQSGPGSTAWILRPIRR